MRRRARVWIFALLSGLWGLSLCSQEPSGTLVFDVKPFRSEIELKAKVKERLKTAGIEWGAAEGQMVVALVSKRFIRFDLPYLTRYGEKRVIELAPGAYRLTCVGFIPEGGLSVEKALKKGAYFNLDVLEFQVHEGRTTTIEVQPTIRKHSTWALNIFMPDLIVRVVEDGAVRAEGVINERTKASIAWD
ncbi:MAG: hypothetical protein ACLGI9_10390, partial [Thermoanaerobaculia bacterium]